MSAKKRGGGEEIDGGLWGGVGGQAVVPDRRSPLTPDQEVELAKARAGQREWVGPAVAAYMLGISQDTLRKRRQRKAKGMVPEWRPAKSNRQGVRYVWTSVQRCANPGSDDVLAQQARAIEALERQVRDQQELLRRVLECAGAGLQALAVDHAWTVDEQQRVLGLAALNPGMNWRPMTWGEALLAPWENETSRRPYHDAAMALLQRVEAACETPAGGR